MIRLSDGFATLFENVINDLVFPEKNAWEQFLLDFMDVLFSNDLRDFLQPLNQYAESRGEITRKFDRLNLIKGAVVLRMFKDAITDDTFNKGLSNYLTARQNQTATPEDLFAGLQQAYDEDFPDAPIDIAEMMSPWLDFTGFPVVTVSRSENGLSLTQEGFSNRHNELFNIPINYATASQPDFNDTRADFWLTSSELEITIENATKIWTEDDWVIFNLRDTGYYLTNYDDELWSLIVNALNDDHEAIHFLNRGTLYADFTRFLEENYNIDATLLLQMMESLPIENNAHVYIRADPAIQKIENRLRGSELNERHLSFLRNVLGPVYNDNRFENNSVATAISIASSCFVGVPECLDAAVNELLDEMESGSPLTPNPDRCNGFMGANETVWMHFFNQATSARSAETAMLLRSLVCTRDSNLLRLLLDTALDFSNFLFAFERSTIFSAAANQNAESYEVTVDFMEEHGSVLQGITDVGNLIFQLAAVTNTEEQAEKVS